MQLGSRGAEPRRRGEKLTQLGRIADGLSVVKEKLPCDRLRREEGAEIEQVLRVRGQQRGGHRPGSRHRGREIRKLLAEEPVRIRVELREVVVDALLGLGEVGRGVFDGDGQMTECSRQPSRLAASPLILVLVRPSDIDRGQAPCAARS